MKMQGGIEIRELFGDAIRQLNVREQLQREVFLAHCGTSVLNFWFAMEVCIPSIIPPSGQQFNVRSFQPT